VKLMVAAELILKAVDPDPTREGLRDTPTRFANAWMEFIEYKPGKIATAFSDASTDQMVVVRDMRVWTYCEHHLLPFWCDITIAYIPCGKVLGLSKFARIAQLYAHRLQIQERLVQQIADEVQRLTGTTSVAVLGKGQHLCMLSRGIRSDGIMTTSVMRGSFRESPATRAEFFHLSK
jgi:GTP cyclohydrolase I